MIESASVSYSFSGSAYPIRSSARPALKELTDAVFEALLRKKSVSIPSKRSSRWVRGARISENVEIRSCARSPGEVPQRSGSHETFSLIYSTSLIFFITECASVSISGSLFSVQNQISLVI